MKKIVYFTMIFSLLFILGCSGGSRDTPTFAEYRIGTQGLEIDYTPNSPPYVVYAEDESFPVTVEIKNKGVFPGEGDGTLTATLYFVGFDKDIITGLDPVPVVFEEEEAKTRFNSEGGFTVISSEARVDPGFFNTAKIDTYDANLVSVLCYPYKTFASMDICVDPNPNRDSSLDACIPGVTGSGSQGAPVAVSSVDSVSQKGKARFVITVNNVGGGTVLRETELARCTDVELDREDLDKVTITSAKLSNGIPLDCTPDEGTVSLINGRGTLICKAEGLDSEMPAFKTVLQLELSYGYKQSVQKIVQIQGE